MATANSKNSGYLRAGKVAIPLKMLRNLILGLTLIVFGAGIGYQYRDLSLRHGVSIQNRGVSLNREDLDFSMFWDVWDTLQTSYLDPEALDAEKMIYGAIQGMTAAIGDPYTIFLPPADNQQAKEDLNGEFDGVGIQLGYKRDTIAVMAPLEGHPAINAGVKAGDLILNIKDENKGVDEDTAGMTLPEAVKLIRGKKGMPVTLTLYRDEKGQFEVTMLRDTIVIPSVEMKIGKLGDDGKFVEDDSGEIVWMQVHRFGENTQSQWDKAVTEILRNKAQLKGMILDVRNNPGGFLQGAISLASDFIPEGVVVEQEGRYDKESYEVDRRGRLLGMPVIVVINGGSASASEILSGALRDRINARLVGERSFGKGTVQEAMDLTGNAGLHVTTSRWLLPSGDWIHEEGLEPDIEVALPSIDEATQSGELVDTQMKTAMEELLSL